MEHYDSIRRLLDAVRGRWLRLRALRAASRAALVAAVVIGATLVASRWMTGHPTILAVAAVAAMAVVAGACVWSLLPLRRRPTDVQVARYIEERAPQLEDRLASAVDAASGRTPTPFRDLAVADAARRAERVEIDAVIPADRVRRVGVQAAATAALVAIILFAGREPAREALDAASLTFFPARTALDVTPGDARVKAGTALDVRAHLVGNRAPVIAQLQIADGATWRAADMASDGRGQFHLTMGGIAAPFVYRVVAGSLSSPSYHVTVAHAPRVTRIDVDYAYPAGLGLAPRTEPDSGDIYAPAGTGVKIHVLTDRPAATGSLSLGDGKSVALGVDSPTELSASLTIVDDNSYRIALADGEGMANPGDTEYFIRTLEDRPPEVRILRPASDRSVTRLEEVDIEAQAEDDYGVDTLDLVYVVRDKERSVPLAIDRKSAFVKGRHTLYLEDLDVQPGDVVAYYARAKDLTRGTRPNEARSDIFFLEVRPFDQEFAMATSQGAGGGGGRSSIDDLVTAQKDVVVSTFKIDRRAQAAKAKSEQDIRSVSRAEAELKTRVEQMSSTFRESEMRDPRRRAQGRGGPPQPKAGDTLPEEDDMGAAAAAMGRAVASLDALKTGPAMTPEMEALNRLLKAQADVKKREVQRAQAGSGAGNNRSNVDISSLFDRELKKQQQTNYETRSSAEQRQDPNQSALDKIKELAERQDALNQKLQELARNRDQMSEADLKRELDRLTREQSELRQKAEDLARQMNQQPSGQPNGQEQNGQQQDAKNGQQGQQGQQGQSGRSGQSGQSGQSGTQSADRAKGASEAMRNATSDLRRQDPKQASASGAKALDDLRQLQRQLEGGRPDERRRAVGDLQLEARQLADAERRIASDLARTPEGDAGQDAVRRLAGEQDRLADRARKLQDGLKQQAQGKAPGSSSQQRGGNPQSAADAAARELDRQRLADRVQESAEALRAAAAGSRGRGRAPSEEAKSQANTGRDLARSFDKVADALGSANGTDAADSRKLSEQRARAEELRGRIGQSAAEMDRLAQQNGQRSGGSSSKAPGQTGRAGEGQQGGGGGSGADLARLRDDYARSLRDTQQLLEELRKQDPTGQTFSRGGTGFTFQNQGQMTLSAPGTEAFKQDYAKWEEMRRQATQALENAESSLGRQIQAKQAKERLAAGADDKAPAEYQKQVDNYFKAIAKKKM